MNGFVRRTQRKHALKKAIGFVAIAAVAITVAGCGGGGGYGDGGSGATTGATMGATTGATTGTNTTTGGQSDTSVVLPPAPTFTQVQTIITQRCVACHSAHPTQPGFTTAPAGIMLDTEAQIRANAAMIYQVVVQTRTMPYGNATGMTDDERTQVGQWYTLGAK